MATLKSLKAALRQKAKDMAAPLTQPLSDAQYDAGFHSHTEGPKTSTYQDFIIPQLSQLLEPLLKSRAGRTGISILEIGAGPKSVVGALPDHQRRKIVKYTALEPNDRFATRLEGWLAGSSETDSPLPCLEIPPKVHRTPFTSEGGIGLEGYTYTDGDVESFDVILFCHSMYGMVPKREYIEKALEMLTGTLGDEMVVVFHVYGSHHFDGLVCHRTAPFPTGAVRIEDQDEMLDDFARFLAGGVTQDKVKDKALRAEWRKLCRALGHRRTGHPDHLFFSAPNFMAAFTQHATTLPELMKHVWGDVGRANRIKNREALRHQSASIVRPEDIREVQHCVSWALEHGFGLTVIGGSHSDHCLWPNVVAIDMGAFDQISIVIAEDRSESSESSVDSSVDSNTSVMANVGAYADTSDDSSTSTDPEALIVVEAGCKIEDIIRRTAAVGITVPLGSRPSVGAGLWLQGGIGHLARLHGLACDSIVGAVIVDVVSGRVLRVGRVPRQCRPMNAVRPENDRDLLWALKGAGTNFGIVISVTFQGSTASMYSIHHWVIPLTGEAEARGKLQELDRFATNMLALDCSMDAYLYSEQDQLHLGVSMCQLPTDGFTNEVLPAARAVFGPEDASETVNGIGLFDTEMYVSTIHCGNACGKTSSFKRCLFLKDVGQDKIGIALITAVLSRPSPRCYLHLLQGGGAVGDVGDIDSAFGCRDWDFACVITGVWPRDQDDTDIARAVVQWVYDVAGSLLPMSSGVYSADLGPGIDDAALAAKAFGPNLPRLARLKQNYDPANVLRYTCPIPKAPKPKLIVLVTGDSCAGKDYCAARWAHEFTTSSHASFQAHVASISDSTKRDYAAAVGADFDRLLKDRVYKEEHRQYLSRYYKRQVRLRLCLPEDHFLSVVYEAGDVDVLFVTGMREEAPVASFAHLVPDSRLVEVNVRANSQTRQARRKGPGWDGNDEGTRDSIHCPDFIFNNDAGGVEATRSFYQRSLLPLLHSDLQQLTDMVRSVPDFPRRFIEFRDVLGIAQQPGGLRLCITLLQGQFTGEWAKVDAIVCCEVGGLVFAPILAARIDVPLVLIREAGKLPPPLVTVSKSPSHISASSNSRGTRIEMDQHAVRRGATVMVVDDVLATGETLCAVLQLLAKAGIGAENVEVMVVAEFPLHRGRERLRQCGFGGVKIHSLLVFGGK